MHTNDTQLSEILKRLEKEFHPDRIYLFGSRARGQASSESDYDLLLVIKDSPLSKIERMQKAQEALWGIWGSADIVVFTQAEFDQLKEEPSSLVSTVLREGQLLNAA